MLSLRNSEVKGEARGGGSEETRPESCRVGRGFTVSSKGGLESMGLSYRTPLVGIGYPLVRGETSEGKLPLLCSNPERN